MARDFFSGAIVPQGSWHGVREPCRRLHLLIWMWLVSKIVGAGVLKRVNIRNSRRCRVCLLLILLFRSRALKLITTPDPCQLAGPMPEMQLNSQHPSATSTPATDMAMGQY